MNLLFICSRNRLRSPIAEAVFSAYAHLNALSAGLNHDAEQTVTPELVRWVEVIFVMENKHRSMLRKRFRAHLKEQRVVCLEIPDIYDFMDPALIDLLKRKVGRYLGLRFD